MHPRSLRNLVMREIKPYFGWKVQACLSAKDAPYRNILLRLIADPGRDVPLTPLALHGENFPGVRMEKPHAEL